MGIGFEFRPTKKGSSGFLDRESWRRAYSARSRTVFGPIGTSRVLKNFESRTVRTAPETSTSLILKDNASDVRKAAPYIRRMRTRITDASRSLRGRRHDPVESNMRRSSSG